MDIIWDVLGGKCFGMFPPSFYYTHTEEETKLIMAETTRKLQKIIDQMMETDHSQP